MVHKHSESTTVARQLHAAWQNIASLYDHESKSQNHMTIAEDICTADSVPDINLPP